MADAQSLSDPTWLFFGIAYWPSQYTYAISLKYINIYLEHNADEIYDKNVYFWVYFQWGANEYFLFSEKIPGI